MDDGAGELSPGPEIYLRCRGEDALRTHDLRALLVQARTLVAARILPRDVVLAVLGDLGRARALRGLGPVLEPQYDEDTSPHPMRFHPVDRTLELPWGRLEVRYFTTTPEQTTVVATARPTPGGAAPKRRHAFDEPPELRLADHTGRTSAAHFSGGGSGSEWDGTFTAAPAIAADATWLTIDGVRIELVDADEGVTVERISLVAQDESLAVRALRLLDFDLRRGRPDGFDPLWAALETAAALLGSGVPPTGITDRLARAEQDAAVPATVPAPGRAPSGPGRRQRPTRAGVPAVRPVTPGVAVPIDGVQLYVVRLQTEDGFLEVELTGNGPLVLHNHDQLNLDSVTLLFEARDDLGNSYIGENQQSGSGSEGFHSNMRYEPELAPDASTIHLHFVSFDVDVVVTVPLSRVTP